METYSVNRIKRFASEHKISFYLLCIVIFVGFVVAIRLPMFGYITSRMWWLPDDCHYVNVANNILGGNGFWVSILDYNQVIQQMANGQILYKYDLWDYAGRPYYFGGALYPLFLSAVFWITSATAPSWIVIGGWASMLLVFILSILVYFIAKKVFNIKVAIISAIVIQLLPPIYWFSMRTVPYMLFLIFALAAILLTKHTSKHWHWLFVGVLVALSHLTHSMGIMVMGAIFIYCVYKRQFIDASILVGGYLVIMAPWLIRNQLLFNDVSMGLGIPVTTILNIFGVKYGMYTIEQAGSVANIGTNLLRLFNHVAEEMIRLYKMFGILAIIGACGLVGFNKLRNKRVYVLEFIYCIISVLGYVWLAVSKTSAEGKYLMLTLILLIPLVVWGIIESLPKFKTNKLIVSSFTAFLVGVTIWTLVSFSISLNQKYNIPMALQPSEIEFHEWVDEQNLPPDTLVMSNAPNVLYLGAGIDGIYMFTVNNIDFQELRDNIKKYEVDYLAIYVYNKHPLETRYQLYYIELELGVKEIYRNDTVRFYEVL